MFLLLPDASVFGGRIPFCTPNSALTQEVNNITIDAIAMPHELFISNNTFLDVHGNIVNNGIISLNSTAANTQHRADGFSPVLSGTGRVTLGAGGPNRLSATGDNTWTNSAGHTIEGVGNIGNNTAQIVNEGMIDANNGAGSLRLDPRNVGVGLTTLVNNGVARASNGGTLEISGGGGGEFGGSGTFSALAGSEVVITVGAVVSDVTFSTAGTGLVRVADGQNVAFANINNTGIFEVGNNTDARMSGTITNSGEIRLATTGNQSDFELGTDVSLTGGGTLTLPGPAAQINAIGNLALTNVDNTIRGVGSVGGNSAQIVNRGLIDADGSGNILSLDPRNNGVGVATFTNEMTGVMRARNGGILRASGFGGGEFLNHNGGRVVVESTLEVVSNGIFRNETGGRVEGDGVIAVISGTFNHISGTVAPGLSTGILDVTGNYSQRADGTLEIEVAGPTPGTQYDRLAVSGMANLDGTVDGITLAGQADPAVRGGVQETIFLTAGSSNGFFATLLYDGTTVTPLEGVSSNGSFVGYVGTSDAGIDGMFRGLRYDNTSATLIGYLALAGDANGDGTVDVSDFNVWNNNKFTNGTTWITGDFNGDGITDVSDFNIWNVNKFTSVSLRTVPEPSALSLVWLIGAAMATLSWRRRRGGRS